MTETEAFGRLFNKKQLERNRRRRLAGIIVMFVRSLILLARYGRLGIWAGGTSLDGAAGQPRTHWRVMQ